MTDRPHRPVTDSMVLGRLRHARKLTLNRKLKHKRNGLRLRLRFSLGQFKHQCALLGKVNTIETEPKSPHSTKNGI